MNARRVTDPLEFLADATPFLISDEPRHNLIFGIAGTLRDRPGHYPDFRLWLVEDDGQVVGAALRTPPFNLVLAQPGERAALSTLADALADDEQELPGVVAASPEVDDFAAEWESRRNVKRRLRMASRIYRLTDVRSPAGVSGRARVATPQDRKLLVDWLRAFAEEALHEAPSPARDAEWAVDGRLKDEWSGFMLWEDGGEPVSLAGWGGRTPTGIRVGPVYTPPDRRSRGYGSAVSAAVSAEQLAGGRQFCFLYTDLANPTSNKIYMDIGYEPVCDSVDYGFEPAP
jgi:uncharacterized protein